MTPAPSRTRLITEALLPLAAAAFALARGHSVAAGLLGGLGASLVLAALFAPWVGVALHRLGRHLGQRLAGALAWVLLGGVHLLVFTPAGLLLRLAGRDPLSRRFPGDQPSYWIRPAPRDRARIRRTF